MNQIKDIETQGDIELLINYFYKRVRADEVLFPVFTAIIGSNWDEHIKSMQRFWQDVLLESRIHPGISFFVKARMFVGAVHFAKWLELWHASIDELFRGEKADEAKWRGDRIAVKYLLKLEKYQKAARPFL